MNQPENNIINELHELSPTLAAIPRVNLFKVPDGYFESFPALLLLNIGMEEATNLGLQVPGTYFKSLSDNILSRVKETDDVLGSNFSSMGRSNPLSVPAGYFDSLSLNILDRLKKEGDSAVFTETNEISTIVAGIGTRNVFTVPDSYFKNLSPAISAEMQPIGKLIKMNNGRKFLRYAAAAVITGVLALSAFFIFNKEENSVSNGLVASNSAVMDTAISIINTNSFDQQMATLSDEDIVAFLESKGQDVDAALVASMTEDEKSLPEATDYLFNENALDNILKDLDLSN